MPLLGGAVPDMRDDAAMRVFRAVDPLRAAGWQRQNGGGSAEKAVRSPVVRVHE